MVHHGRHGSNFMADMASSDGTAAFSGLQDATGWEPGDCPAATP
jgi:hypothetical protein